MWDLILSVPDHCLSFYFKRLFRKYGASNVNETFRFDASIDIKARYPSILFGFPRMPFVNCRQCMYLVISVLALRVGCGI